MILGFFPGGIVVTARAAENVTYLEVKITLNWTEETKASTSITASSYAG